MAMNAQVAKLVATMELDLSRFNVPLNQMEARLRRLVSVPLRIPIHLDTAPAYQQMARLNADLQRLRGSFAGMGAGGMGGGFAGRGATGLGGAMAGMGVGGGFGARGGRGVGPGMGGTPIFMGTPMGPAGRFGRQPTAAARVRRGAPRPTPLYMPGGPFPGAMGTGMGGMGFGSQFGSGMASRMVGMPLFNPAFAAGAITAGAVGGSLRTAVQTESQMVDLRRISGRPASEMPGLERNLEQIAARTPGAKRADTFSAATVAARMGIQDIEGFVEPMLQLSAVLPELDMETLANNTGRVMGVFKMGTEQVEGFSSAILQMANETKSTVDTTLDILRRLSGARAAGLGFAESTALAVAMQEAGLRTESGATALDRVLVEIGTSKGRDRIAKALGIAPEAFKATFNRSPMEALQQVFAGIERAPMGSERLEFLSQEMGFGNVRDLTLLGNLASQSDRLGGFAETIQEQFEAPTALAEGTAMRAETASGALEQLGVSIENLANSLAKPLLPMLKDFADGFTLVSQALTAGPGGKSVYEGVRKDWLDFRQRFAGLFGDVSEGEDFRLTGEGQAPFVPEAIAAITEMGQVPGMVDLTAGPNLSGASSRGLPEVPNLPPGVRGLAAASGGALRENLAELNEAFFAERAAEQELVRQGAANRTRLGGVFGDLGERIRMGVTGSFVPGAEKPFFPAVGGIGVGPIGGAPNVNVGGQAIMDQVRAMGGGIGQMLGGFRGNPLVAALMGEQKPESGIAPGMGSLDQMLEQRRMDILSGGEDDRQVEKLEAIEAILDGIGKAVGGLQGQVLSLPALLSGGNA